MKHLEKATLRLAATYLAIIMVMCVSYSTIFYATSAHQLERRRGPQSQSGPYASFDDTVDSFLSQRESEGKHALLMQLIGVNVMTFIVGALVSYLLAEQTMRPIKENIQAQTQFVSDASHELRTPLTALRTANEVALRQPHISESQAREVIAGTVEDVTRLQALTDSLLDLLKDDNAHVLQYDVNLQTVVGRAMNLVANQAVARDIAVDDNVRPYAVHGNEQSLTQVVTILLDNAIKYSPDGSTISVMTRRHGKAVDISVSDEGIGMSQETQAQIFTRFYRADQARTRQGSTGYGLGLAIAKKIIEAHHGQIFVKSEPGKGTTFTVRLNLSLEVEHSNSNS